MIEIYTKNAEDDSDFNDMLTDVTNDLHVYLNQIRNIFSAENGAVMGAAGMGVNLEEMIYEYSVSAKSLEKKIYEQIQQYCTLHYKFKTIVSAKFAKGTLRDVAFIDIIIDDVKQLELRIK